MMKVIKMLLIIVIVVIIIMGRILVLMSPLCYIRLGFLPRSVWNKQTRIEPPSPQPNPSPMPNFLTPPPPPCGTPPNPLEELHGVEDPACRWLLQESASKTPRTPSPPPTPPLPPFTPPTPPPAPHPLCPSSLFFWKPSFLLSCPGARRPCRGGARKRLQLGASSGGLHHARGEDLAVSMPDWHATCLLSAARCSFRKPPDRWKGFGVGV